MPAYAQSMRWEAAVDVSAVRIEIKHVSPLELATLQHRYVARDTDPHAALDNDHREGLAILFTNKETGERRCEIYVASGMRASKLADVLAHEAAHCFGFTHE